VHSSLVPTCVSSPPAMKVPKKSSVPSAVNFRSTHRQWVDDTLRKNSLVREAEWSEAVAVGSKAFIEETQHSLGLQNLDRACQQWMVFSLKKRLVNI